MPKLFKLAIIRAFVFTFILCFEGYAQSEVELFSAKNTVLSRQAGIQEGMPQVMAKYFTKKEC